MLLLCCQMAKLLGEEQLTEPEVEDLCSRATEILQREGNVKDVPAPCTVVGDIHGQLHDFIEILKIGGAPPDTNFVFMGDFVDRGYHSVECVSLVLTFKVRDSHENRPSRLQRVHRRARLPRACSRQRVPHTRRFLACSGAVAGSRDGDPRQPRVASDHTGVRVLRRVRPEIRLR